MTNSKIITIDPTISTGAYAAGDNVGGKLTLSDAAPMAGGSGVIQSVTVIDLDSEEAALDIVFFDQDPSGTTFTDNGALTIADADLDNAVGYISILAGDYVAAVNNSIATVVNLSLVFACIGDRDLYAGVITRGTPTYTATGDLRFRFGILQDV